MAVSSWAWNAISSPDMPCKELFIATECRDAVGGAGGGRAQPAQWSDPGSRAGGALIGSVRTDSSMLWNFWILTSGFNIQTTSVSRIPRFPLADGHLGTCCRETTEIFDCQQCFSVLICVGRWVDGDHVELTNDDLVAHVVGSSPQRGNWSEYWCMHTNRQWPPGCRIQGCGGNAEVGAHVWVKHCHQTFIIPTCQRCNRDGIHDYNGAATRWVSVNQGTLAVRVVQHPGVYY
jgi:hypothetical protein